MKKKSILYLFRRPVEGDIKSSLKGKYPEDFFYGYTRIDKRFEIRVTDRLFKRKILLSAELFAHKLITPFTRIGFSLLSVISTLREINKVDLVFATVDSYGLPLAFLKSIGLVRVPIIINTIGLLDALIDSKSKIYVKFCRWILKRTSYILSGASNYECQKLAQILNLPVSKFKFISFGIDTDYFSPSPKPEEDYILAIGADPKRDWQLHSKVANYFPKTKFVFVTTPTSLKEKVGTNVQIFYNLPIDKVRSLIQRSSIVLLLSQQNYHFAGQSTAFRAMSCQKAVILTKSFGIEEYDLRDKVNSLLVKPANFKQVVAAIDYLNQNPKPKKQIEKNARAYILKNCNLADYANRLNKIFKEALT